MSMEATSVIDREKQCPFLLRVFYGPGEKPKESEIISSEAPELQIYTWKDATLGELSLAIKKAIPDMIAQAGPGCLLEFRHMAPEADRSSYTGRDIGTVRLDQVLPISSTGSAPDQEGISTKDIHSNTRDSNRRSDRHSRSEKPNKSYEKTLQMVRHMPGDFLTVAVASVRPGFISANTRFSLENSS
ncbi:Histone deacetylase complex subunit sap18, partial [Podila minutissima]